MGKSSSWMSCLYVRNGKLDTYKASGGAEKQKAGKKTQGLLSMVNSLPKHKVPTGVYKACVQLSLARMYFVKSDCMSALEKDRDYREEHFDFIQQHIRRHCLKYGATLFYTSVKENKNCSLLYRYLVHQIYGLPFNSPALVVEKDSVFIPAGWDSVKKINILSEHLKAIQPEDAFDDHIVKPQLRKPIQDKEILAEDEQTFLAKQQQLLQKMPATVASGIARQQPDITKPRAPGMGSPSGRMSTDRRPSAGMSPGPRGPKVEGGKPGAGGAASEGVLANFFNSLLNKKSGTGAAMGRGGTAVRSDAAAELDRMNRAKKMVPQGNAPNDTTETS